MDFRRLAKQVERAGKTVVNTATAGAVDAVEDLIENKGKEEAVSKAEFDALVARVDRLIETMNEHHHELRQGLRRCLRKVKRMKKNTSAS